MPHRSPFVVASAALLAAALGGCHHELPPATTIASAIPTAGSTEASVIFLRPTSPCDESDYTVVVDEQGRFVGNVAPGTLVQLSTGPGAHTFYAWSSIDLRVEKEPNFNPVAAVHVDATPGKPHYVALLGRRAHYDCTAGALVDMLSLDQYDALNQELPGWLEKVQPVTSNRAEGQAKLAARPALFRTYIELGQQRMHRVDETRVREDRHDAIRSETAPELSPPAR